MHKFTLFTVILSIITVSIVIDIVVNGYSLSKDYIPPKEDGANMVETTDLSQKTVSDELSSTRQLPEPAKDTPEKSSTDTETDTQGDVTLYGFVDKDTITSETLAEVGINDGKIKPIGTDKPFLQVVSLPENVKNRLKVINLFDFEEYLGTIYALHFLNLKDAEQFYSDVKAEALEIPGAEIRETNTFGDASFYLNQQGKTKTAFTALRIGSSVYGFEYPHSSHQTFKSLAEKLNKDQ